MTHATPHTQLNTLSSPLPGRVIEVRAQEGDAKNQGESVFIIESMKMFHELRMPKHGKLSNIQVKVGDSVQPNHHLAYVR